MLLRTGAFRVAMKVAEACRGNGSRDAFEVAYAGDRDGAGASLTKSARYSS